jgi:hypothetical protein
MWFLLYELRWLASSARASYDTSARGGRSRANTMSAKTILRDISQAVGGAFPIFWEKQSWEWLMKSNGKRWRKSE